SRARSKRLCGALARASSALPADVTVIPWRWKRRTRVWRICSSSSTTSKRMGGWAGLLMALTRGRWGRTANGEPETAALAGRALAPAPAPPRLDDVAPEVRARAGPLGPPLQGGPRAGASSLRAAHERLEEALAQVVGDARPVVRHAEQDELAVGLAGDLD